MNRPTRLRARRLLDADETLSSNDKSGLEVEEETKPRTDDDLQVKRKKLDPEENVETPTTECLDDVEKNIEMNPVVSNGNIFQWKFEKLNELTSHKVLSEKFTFRNVDWKMFIRSHTKNGMKFFVFGLNYEGDNKINNNWICETEITTKLVNQNDNGEDWTNSCTVLIANLAGFMGHREIERWSELESEGYLKNDSIIVEFDLSFKYYDFSKTIPNFTDLAISVNQTIFHVNTGMLCAHSKYFFNLFVNQNNQETYIELDDVDENGFVVLMASFYPFFQPDRLRNYEKLIQLATKYECASLHSNCEKFLISFTRMELVEKFKYAEQHDYHQLMKFCLTSLESAQEIKRLRKSAGFNSLKESTKLSIMTRLLDFF